MAHVPDHLPHVEADLADWMVYADELLHENDPLGELIAFDVAMPIEPAGDQLLLYKQRATPRCWTTRDGMYARWSLGFIRELLVLTDAPGLHLSSFEENAFEDVLTLLSMPYTSRLETFHLPLADEIEHLYPAILGRLPATCRTFVGAWPWRMHDPPPYDLGALLAALPSQVVELQLDRYRPEALTDRFEVVTVKRMTDETWADARSRLASTSRVRLRTSVVAKSDLETGRVEPLLDAGFVIPSAKRIESMLPSDPMYLQRRDGLMPIRTQLAVTHPDAWFLPTFSLRRTGDRWTVRYDTKGTEVVIGDRALEIYEVAQIVDGDSLRIDGTRRTFCTRDLALRGRAM
ncbi:MAG: hypothetical protein QM831_01655 [Kofleriaceae bacterium]